MADEEGTGAGVAQKIVHMAAGGTRPATGQSLNEETPSLRE